MSAGLSDARAPAWAYDDAGDARREAEAHLVAVGRQLAAAAHSEIDGAVQTVLRSTAKLVGGHDAVVFLAEGDTLTHLFAWTPFGLPPPEAPAFDATSRQWLSGLVRQHATPVVIPIDELPEVSGRIRWVARHHELQAVGIIPAALDSRRAAIVLLAFRAFPDARKCMRFEALGALAPLLVAVGERQQHDDYELMARAAERLRNLVHRSPDIVLGFDSDATLTFVSPSVRDILGYEPAELVGHNVMELVHPDDLASIVGGFGGFPPGGARRSRIFRIRHQDGTWRTIDSMLTDLRDDPGFRTYIAIARDVTDVVETQHALERNEQQIRTLLRHSTDVVVVIDRQGRLVRPVMTGLLGYAENAQPGVKPIDLVHPDDRGEAQSALERAMNQPGTPVRVELRAHRTDGAWRYLEITFTDCSDDPVVGGVVVNARDVTERVEAERQQHESEDRVRLLAERASDMIYRFRVVGERGFEYVSPAAEDLTGFHPAAFYDDPMLIVKRMHPDDRDSAVEQMRRTDPGVHRIRIRWKHRNGKWIWTEHRTVPVLDDDGNMIAAEGIARDVTQQVVAERELRRREHIASAVLDSMVGPAAVLDADGTIIQLNSEWSAELSKRSPRVQRETVVGANYLALCDAAARRNIAAATQVAEGVRAVLSGAQESFGLDYPIIEDGEQRWFVMRVSPLRSDTGGAVLQNIDITDRKRYERELAARALHDPLTGLPNRALFTDRLSGAVARARWRRPSVGVLVLDLDRFSVVNETMGHTTADGVLVAAATRLRKVVRDGDTVARLGGDEFVVLCEGPHVEREVEALAERVVRAFRASLRSGSDQAAVVTVSVGVALGTRKSTGDDLLRQADTAMHRAKQLGRNRYERFDERVDTTALRRLSVEAELQGALDRGECRLVYQPIVDLSSARIDGVEALLRWEHPTRGLLSPDEFLEVAEDAGLLIPIGGWVMREACVQLRAWQDAHPQQRELSISVNVAAQQMQQPDFPDEVRRAVDRAGIDPRCVVIELTESSLLDAQINDVIARLHDIGVRIAIDDFGTGYSSMSYLKRFAIDEVKIDRSFVEGIGHDADDEVILTAILELSRNLGLGTVAEGIESPAQREMLLALGCNRGQGYLFAKPCEPSEIDGLLA